MSSRSEFAHLSSWVTEYVLPIGNIYIDTVAFSLAPVICIIKTRVNVSCNRIITFMKRCLHDYIWHIYGPFSLKYWMKCKCMVIIGLDNHVQSDKCHCVLKVGYLLNLYPNIRDFRSITEQHVLYFYQFFFLDTFDVYYKSREGTHYSM